MTLPARLSVLAAGALLCMAFAVPARAAVPMGGALDPPGERSHTVGLGWPELSYTWEGLVRPRSAFGVRVGLQVWPLALSVAGQARVQLTERGPLSLALLIAPGIGVAGYGGSKAVYLQNFGFGRSRTFRASLGPQLNVGILASVALRPKVNLLLTWENPVAVWVWTRPVGWWIEWPVIVTGGLEYRASFAWSLFGRVGAGPSIAFAGPSLLLGIHWHIVAGVQIRY